MVMQQEVRGYGSGCGGDGGGGVGDCGWDGNFVGGSESVQMEVCCVSRRPMQRLHSRAEDGRLIDSPFGCLIRYDGGSLKVKTINFDTKNNQESVLSCSKKSFRHFIRRLL